LKLENLPTGITDWSQVPVAVASGASGSATMRTREFGPIRLRLVDYSAGYIADHWCAKGHIIFVVAGRLMIEHEDGERHVLTAGMSYHVSDEVGPAHRVMSDGGAIIFVVD
jgi:hypothetical protein